ncbi:MAG: molybdate ABC transporter substrate-binding protein [Chloroflexota bacterium]|nr:MAG: molybdate ABC transporter substrate-binding protein [Chloroflexota bacterium]
MRSWSLVIGLALVAAAVLLGCQAQAAVGRANAGPITVAAAADLQFAFREIGDAFQQETGRKVIFTFGSTGVLAQQIGGGAPIDVFAAANVQFVDELRTRGLILADTQQPYAQGRIVLATNKKSRLAVHTLSDLVRPEIKWVAIANPEHAPYGRAAQQALQSAGVWEQVKSKLVLGENISQTMQYVQTGNADIGIIALSVANVPELEWVLIDQNLHAPLNQSMAVVSSTKHEQTAREFVQFVNGPSGRPIMKKYGFVLPGEL